MIIDPGATPAQQVYKILIGSVVPRPIGFISTVSVDGKLNLAPFSFFNAVCGDPPIVAFAASFRNPRKDSYVNIKSTGEFVVNIVNEEIAQNMNLTSGEYPHGHDEFEISGLTPIASDLVNAPRVAESPVNMECKLRQIIDFSEKPHGASLVLGEVIRFHVDDWIVHDYKIDPDKLRAIGRMGGNEYTRTRDRFEMIRPKV